MREEPDQDRSADTQKKVKVDLTSPDWKVQMLEALKLGIKEDEEPNREAMKDLLPFQRSMTNP